MQGTVETADTSDDAGLSADPGECPQQPGPMVANVL
jgi:hypothetical protein